MIKHCKTANVNVNANDLDESTANAVAKELGFKNLAWMIAADGDKEDALVLGIPKDSCIAETFASQKALISALPPNARLTSADHIQIVRLQASPGSTAVCVTDPNTGNCIWVVIKKS